MKLRECPACMFPVYQGYYDGKLTFIEAYIRAEGKEFEWIEILPHTCKVKKEEITNENQN